MLSRTALSRDLSRPENRRGAVLLLVAMLSFGIFALMSLCIDFGFVVLTRNQMQTAVDAAALEGLRFRDARDLGRRRREAVRRSAASELVALVFDDDLFHQEFLDGFDDDPYNFGAGPSFAVEDRVVRIDDPFVYKPRSSEFSVDKPQGLELNQGNQPHGDLVAGRYLGLEDPFVSHSEGSHYLRDDFIPAPPGQRRASREAPAFLARMRRTPDRFFLDHVRGVSSGGPAIPLLFGQASLVGSTRASGHSAGNQDGDILVGPGGRPIARPYDIRLDGLSVRATAIAIGRPVMQVGTAVPARDLAGTAPFVLRRDLWNAIAATDLLDASMEADGQVRIPTLGLIARMARPVTRVGEVVEFRDAPPVGTIPPEGFFKGYVGIYERVGNPPVPRVVGFGRAVLAYDPAFPPDVAPFRMKVAKRRTGIAKINATATPLEGFPPMTAEDFRTVLDLNASLRDPLMAPVLAR